MQRLSVYKNGSDSLCGMAGMSIAATLCIQKWQRLSVAWQAAWQRLSVYKNCSNSLYTKLASAHLRTACGSRTSVPPTERTQHTDYSHKLIDKSIKSEKKIRTKLSNEPNSPTRLGEYSFILGWPWFKDCFRLLSFIKSSHSNTSRV